MDDEFSSPTQIPKEASRSAAASIQYFTLRNCKWCKQCLPSATCFPSACQQMRMVSGGLCFHCPAFLYLCSARSYNIYLSRTRATLDVCLTGKDTFFLDNITPPLPPSSARLLWFFTLQCLWPWEDLPNGLLQKCIKHFHYSYIKVTICLCLRLRSHYSPDQYGSPFQWSFLNVKGRFIFIFWVTSIIQGKITRGNPFPYPTKK